MQLNIVWMMVSNKGGEQRHLPADGRSQPGETAAAAAAPYRALHCLRAVHWAINIALGHLRWPGSAREPPILQADQGSDTGETPSPRSAPTLHPAVAGARASCLGCPLPPHRPLSLLQHNRPRSGLLPAPCCATATATGTDT